METSRPGFDPTTPSLTASAARLPVGARIEPRFTDVERRLRAERFERLYGEITADLRR